MAKKKAELTGLDALYASFLTKLSSSEREAIEEMGVAQAMPAFRKYLNSLTEAEMAAAVAGESPEPESEEEE